MWVEQISFFCIVDRKFPQFTDESVSDFPSLHGLLTFRQHFFQFLVFTGKGVQRMPQNLDQLRCRCQFPFPDGCCDRFLRLGNLLLPRCSMEQGRMYIAQPLHLFKRCSLL